MILDHQLAPEMRQALTARQQDCLELRANRLSTKETARKLGISPHTVAMHLRLARVRGHTHAPLEPKSPSGDQRNAAGFVGLFERVAMLTLLLGALLTLIGLADLATTLLFQLANVRDSSFALRVGSHTNSPPAGSIRPRE